MVSSDRAHDAFHDDRFVNVRGMSSEEANTRARWLLRPPELASDTASMIAVVQHALAQIPGPPDQIILLLQPTQPFRTPEHLKKAIALLRRDEPCPDCAVDAECDGGPFCGCPCHDGGLRKGPDSVVSVVPLPLTHSPYSVCRVYGGQLEPWFAYEGYTGWPSRRQDATPAYKRDGTVYAFWRKTVAQHGNIYGLTCRPLILDPSESCELDTEADWLSVEQRWKAQHEG